MNCANPAGLLGDPLTLEMVNERSPMPGEAPNIRHFFERHGRIEVYVPNLIGYARIACSICAFGVARRYPTLCITLYFLSFVCDELDGRAARSFNQTSTLGAVLDMLTDRLSTTGLLVLLCIRYPEWHMTFLLLVFIDIFSHWLQMYSSLVAGDISHKETHNQSLLVQYYYTHRIFMGFCCVCCEVLYLTLYLLGWKQFWQAPVLHLPLPQHLVQRFGAEEPKLPLVLALALLAVPGTVVKQIVNLAQIKAASRTLIKLDQQRDKLEENKSC